MLRKDRLNILDATLRRHPLLGVEAVLVRRFLGFVDRHLASKRGDQRRQGDAIELTHTYPYEEINDYLRLHPESRAKVEDTVAYFDGINFADKISCPIIVNIGLQDNVCPPETGHVLFDRIGAKDKHLYPYDGHGHDAGRARHSAVVDRFFAHHLLGREVSG